MKQISDNIKTINENIKTAVENSNGKIKSFDDVTLVGVTKTVDTARISAMLDIGVTQIGENKAQELMDKYSELSNYKDNIKWNFIGHLQQNKVRQIIDKVDLIQSVDSERLLAEIDKRAKAINKVQDILIEVNVSKEETKFGVFPENLSSFMKNVEIYDNIMVKGLMTVAPFVENPSRNKKIFKKMYELFLDNKSNLVHNVIMETLSMGMSNDYTVAIEEGSNMIRVGSNIFGSR